jgi:hypothetical protein
VKSEWVSAFQSKGAGKENTILKDNNASVNNRTPDKKLESDSTEKLEAFSNKISKNSFPLSPIDSQNVLKMPSRLPDLESREVKNVSERSHPLIKHEPSDQMNLHSEQSLNDMCSSVHNSSNFFKGKEEIKEENHSYAASS